MKWLKRAAIAKRTYEVLKWKASHDLVELVNGEPHMLGYTIPGLTTESLIPQQASSRNLFEDLFTNELSF
jgi:hypothetical protein